MVLPVLEGQVPVFQLGQVDTNPEAGAQQVYLGPAGPPRSLASGNAGGLDGEEEVILL